MLLTLLRGSAAAAGLNSYVGSYSVARQHAFFDLEQFTPASGPFWRANGEWAIYRNGSLLKRWIGPKRIGHMLQPTDVVHGRLVDKDGGVSAWASYTGTVTAAEHDSAGAYSYAVWVDAVAGNNANAGTLASPVQTYLEARSRTLTNWVSGGVHAIFLNRGASQTHANTTTTGWPGSDATPGQLQVRAYGTGAKPLLTWTAGTNGFVTGKRQSVLVYGCTLQGNGVDGTYGNLIVIGRSGAGTRNSLESGAIDCDCLGWTNICNGNDSTVNAGNRDSSQWEFLHFEGCVFDDGVEYTFFGLDFLRYFSVIGCTFLPYVAGSGGTQQPMRVYSLDQAFVASNLFDTENGVNAIRPLSYPGATSVTRKLTIHDNDWFGFAADGVASTIQMSGDGAGIAYYEDLEIIRHRASWGQVRWSVDQTGELNSCDVRRVLFDRCALQYSISTSTKSGEGQFQDIEVRDCLFSGLIDETAGFLFGSHVDRYVDGTLHFNRNVSYWAPSGNGFGQRAMLQAYSFTTAELAAKLGSSNHNAVVKSSAHSVHMALCSDGNQSMANWKLLTIHDDDSVSYESTTLPLTNDGQSGILNAIPTATSVLVDAGGSWTGSVTDAAGLLRTGASRDIGPYEWGATTAPDLPAGGGPTTLYADGIGLFAIFGDAEAVARVAADGGGFVSVFGDAEADAKIAADGAAFVSLIGEADASARIAADGAGFIALWGDAEVSETIGGVDPTGGTTGIGYVSIWGDAEAAARVAGDGAGFVSLFGDAEAGARIAADGVGFVSIWGESTAIDVPAATGRGVQLVNDSADLFEGVLSINTDLPVPDAFGQRDGITFVRGLPSSLDTTRVDLIVSIPAGGTITLPDLIAETTVAPTPPTVPANFFGGDPQLAGVPFTKWNEETDGLTVVTEWRLQSGVWIVYLITYNVPGEPWALLECLTLHSNPTSASLREFWPAWLITWGTGTVEFLGRTIDGSVVAAARGFGDGQCVLRPGLAWFPTRYRNAQDTANVAAMRTHKVMGHGIQRLYPDGTPPDYPGGSTWAAGALAGAIARLDDWSVSPHNILQAVGPTGGQADQGFVRQEPYYHPSALLAVYLEACRFGAKPSYFAELNGDVLNLAARPGFRAFDGRPHPPTTQDEPGQPGSGMLGKPAELNPAVHSEDWGGFGIQWWWLNGLVAGARYTGRRGPQKLLEFQSNLYLATRFPPGFGSNTDIFSTRDLMLEGCNTTHFWVNLRNRTMATALRDRARVRANGPWLAWINPTHGFPPAYWQVYPGPTTTASTPFVPAYIPWQQGPGAYYLDLCRRTLGGMEALTSGIVAGAYRVLDDVWTFEFSPTFGNVRWVEYEQQQLPPPYGAGIKGRDGNWTVDWFPPLIALIRRLEPTNTKANEIWDQILAQLGGGGQWIPPEEQTAEVVNYAVGAGFVALVGEAEAQGPPYTRANGEGWLRVFGDADAVAFPLPQLPPPLPPPKPWWWRNIRRGRGWWQR